MNTQGVSHGVHHCFGSEREAAAWSGEDTTLGYDGEDFGAVFQPE